MTTPLTELIRRELAEITAYVPHSGAYEVRLDANEAPTWLDDEDRAALAKAMLPTSLSRYPDARATDLRAAIARRAGVDADQVLVGSGSDEVIALLLTALDRPRAGFPAATVVTPSPTFVMYRVSAKGRGIKVVEVPLDKQWDLSVSSMRAAIEISKPNIVFLASPNNPTGTLMSPDRVAAIIEAAQEALVVIDEAYADFAERGDQATFLARYPNVALLGTLSKVGFAALRVGWLIGPEVVVEAVDKVRQPYNLSVPSQLGATFVLDHLRDEIETAAKSIIRERERVATRLRELGLDVPKSQANFLWVGIGRPAEDVFHKLAARGVLVRSFHERGGRLADRLRITTGTPAENDRLLEALIASL